MAGISTREFARRDGCDEKLVRRALVSGALKKSEDGLLDPALVGTAWRKGNEARQVESATSPQQGADKSAPLPLLAGGLLDGENVDQAVKRIIAAGGAPYSKAEAERVKENYLALTRQLDYELRARTVVPVSEVAGRVSAEYAKVRTRLLAIPAERAPALHRLKSVPELQDGIRRAIAEALEELTRDVAVA